MVGRRKVPKDNLKTTYIRVGHDWIIGNTTSGFASGDDHHRVGHTGAFKAKGFCLPFLAHSHAHYAATFAKVIPMV
jgi:hypothetical protein